LEALTKKFDDLVIIKVDIEKWGSPVAAQFNLKSIPYLEVYDKKGEQLYKGKDAIAYIDRLQKKKTK
jgi:hypothetical protein